MQKTRCGLQWAGMVTLSLSLLIVCAEAQETTWQITSFQIYSSDGVATMVGNRQQLLTPVGSSLSFGVSLDPPWFPPPSSSVWVTVTGPHGFSAIVYPIHQPFLVLPPLPDEILPDNDPAGTYEATLHWEAPVVGFAPDTHISTEWDIVAIRIGSFEVKPPGGRPYVDLVGPPAGTGKLRLVFYDTGRVTGDPPSNAVAYLTTVPAGYESCYLGTEGYWVINRFPGGTLDLGYLFYGTLYFRAVWTPVGLPSYVPGARPTEFASATSSSTPSPTSSR